MRKAAESVQGPPINFQAFPADPAASKFPFNFRSKPEGNSIVHCHTAFELPYRLTEY